MVILVPVLLKSKSGLELDFVYVCWLCEKNKKDFSYWNFWHPGFAIFDPSINGYGSFGFMEL